MQNSSSLRAFFLIRKWSTLAELLIPKTSKMWRSSIVDMIRIDFPCSADISRKGGFVMEVVAFKMGRVYMRLALSNPSDLSLSVHELGSFIKNLWFFYYLNFECISMSSGSQRCLVYTKLQTREWVKNQPW